MLDDDQPQAYSLKGIGKSNSAPIQRVIGWQICEVRSPPLSSLSLIVVADRRALPTQTVLPPRDRSVPICSHSRRWFHGFLSASQARERLQNEKAGTFLLRFSSVPPHFALDLQDGFRVRHWRVEHRLKERKLSIFKDEYESLQQIVDVHSMKPLRLASGSPSTLLREGLSRVAWDMTVVHALLPSAAETMLRGSGSNQSHSIDAPWPPPADWNT